MQHRVWAEIHASAIRHNVQTLRQTANSANIMAVLKADAYGHGQHVVADIIREAADSIAIATLEEGERLREQGCTLPIVCLSGLIDAQQLDRYKYSHITPTFYHKEQLAWLEGAAEKFPAAWVKINTGMNRLGFALDEVSEAIDTVQQYCDSPVALMSHFANADQPDDAHNALQLARFIKLSKSQPASACSMANSAALLSNEESHFDWVRPGVALYGASPFADRSAKSLNLQAAMQLKSSLMSIYTVNAGERIGYGGVWQAYKKTRVGIVSAGYADGYPRNICAEAYLMVSGNKAPIIGRVSMDTLAIDLSGVERCEFAQDVELWGEQLSVDTVASWAGTIGYDLLCKVGQRVPRVNI